MNKKIELFEFRVWFPDTKTFEYYPLYEQNGYTLMMKVMDRDITIYNATYRDKFGDVSITRYTGLKDKSGKEIYEGDIVTYQRTKYEVRNGKFTTGDDCFTGDYLLVREVNSQEMDYGISLYNVIEKVKVVGNIFENK